MFQLVDVMKIKTHFMFNYFFFENRVVYEKMWKNTVESDRPQTKIWRMCIVCWITKATNNTHSEHSQYAVCISVTLQQWLHERASLLEYIYIACLVLTTRIWPTVGHLIFQSFQNLRCRVSSETLTLSQTDIESYSLIQGGSNMTGTVYTCLHTN